MRRAGRKRLGRALFILAGLLILVLSVMVYQSVEEARRQLPGYLSARLSQALNRPVVVGEVGFRLPATFTLRRFRVEALPDEEQAPLVADKVRVGISWWDILVHRRVRVKGLTLVRPLVQTKLDLRKEVTQRQNPAESLLTLRKEGLERIAVEDGEARILTIMPAGDREQVAAHGFDFDARLDPNRFRYVLGADTWSGAGLEAANLRLAGSGDHSGMITVVNSSAQFSGGQLEAQGTYVSENGDVNLRVRVKDLPIGNLAPQVGIPKEWQVQGNLTGTVDLSATSGELRQVQGQVRVARGFVSRSAAVFPWTHANANVDWKPEGIRLDQIDIQGQGIRLQGDARVGGSPKQPLTERPYQAKGTVTAENTQSVAALAQVLTFATPVPGRWDVGQASIDFQAQGVVGELQNSRATGRFQARNFMVRPTPNGAPLVIQNIQGRVNRGPNILRMTQIQSSAEGLNGTGDLEIVPTAPGKPGRYRGSGTVNLTNLAVLRQQMPDLPIWQWLTAARPGAGGRVQFALGGPTQHPERVSGSGAFSLSEFDVTVNAGGTQTWTFPMRSLTGRLALASDRAVLRDLKLRSDLFTGGGAVTLAPVSDQGKLTGSVRLASERWRELPPLRNRVPKELTGGMLVVETRLAGVPVSAKHLPVAGTATLQDATYRGTVGGKLRTAKVEAARVEFRTVGREVRIPSYRLVTPLFATSGSGTLRPAGSAYTLTAAGLLTTGDAGAVMRWWSGQNQLQGGDLTARYTVSTRTDHPEQAALSARVRLTDARPVLPAGSLPFPQGDARIVTLTGNIAARGKQVSFRDLVWQAPRFRVTGTGSLNGQLVNGDFSMSTPQWQAIAGELARSLPVAGGTLTVSGHVQGNVHRLRTAPVRGVVTLRGARLASDKNASVPVEGGHVDLRANVDGTLNNLVGSHVDGTFTLTDLTLPALRAGRSRIRLQTASGAFERRGTTVHLRNLAAQIPGAHLTGSGELLNVGTGKAAHRFHFDASGPALATVLPALVPLPGKASGGKFSGGLTVAGTARAPVTEMDGRAVVQSAEWTPPGQTRSFEIERMAAHFVRHGETATLDNAELRVKGGQATLAGTLQGLGTPAPRHALRVTWRLEDASSWASRFFPVPGWFTGGLFTGNARVTGTPSAPAQTASGEFKVLDAGFMPPAQVLGGPARPIAVRSAQGLFERAGGRTELSKLQLDTSVGTATGTVTAVDRGPATVRAKVNIARLEPLIDLWPGFKDRISGGHATMTVNLSGPLKQPRRLAGNIDIDAAGGVLTVAGVDELYSQHPFDEFSTRLRLRGDGGTLIESVKLIGPRANLDGSGKVHPDGTLEGGGKAWFSKEYTKKVFRPKFLYPVAKLFGHGKLHSRFELHGTIQQARLDMGIKDSLLWKAGLKKKVPEPLRSIATGKTPLWDATAGEKVAGSRQESRSR